jgi:hypothetical protein
MNESLGADETIYTAMREFSNECSEGIPERSTELKCFAGGFWNSSEELSIAASMLCCSESWFGVVHPLGFKSFVLKAGVVFLSCGCTGIGCERGCQTEHNSAFTADKP